MLKVGHDSEIGKRNILRFSALKINNEIIKKCIIPVRTSSALALGRGGGKVLANGILS